MSINDSKTKLKINGLSFKAYLEDSDISYEMKDQQLPFVPTSFVNDTMAIRVMQKAKFSFNVFSETRTECVNNWKNLHTLLVKIRPSYAYVRDQLKASPSNVTGFVNVEFKGLPERNTVTLHLNSFSYAPNKELGYLQVPADLTNNKFYKNPEEKFIPIAYKLSLEGKVLLPFGSTANLLNTRESAAGTINLKDMLGKLCGDEAYQQAVFGIAGTLAGIDPLSMTPDALTTVLAKSKELKDRGIVDQNGKFQETDFGNTGRSLDDRRAEYQRSQAEIQQTAQRGRDAANGVRR